MKLFLDDERTPSQVGLSNDEWIVVRTVDEAIDAMNQNEITHMSLDHDLGCDKKGRSRKNGYDFVKWMAERGRWPSTSVSVHSMNPVGRQNMIAMINRYFVPTRNESV